MKKFLLLALAVVALITASILVAGDSGTAKNDKATTAPAANPDCAKFCNEKSECAAAKTAGATDKTACSKNTSECAKSCPHADGKAGGQCPEACKAKCQHQADCTKHSSGACNPKDCKPGACDPKDCKGHPAK